MSQIESGKLELEPEIIDIEKTVREAGELMNGQMTDKGIRYRVDCDVTQRCVLCDGNHLDRVLMNLLSNACKFTPEGGAVSLSLRQTGEEGESGSYEIRVRDTGIGMSQAFAKTIFQPFEREHTSTVSKTQGTGLGMAITKNIVDRMGGEIQLITEKGKGSEFIVRLSLPYAQVQEQPEREACPCACSGGKARRLLLAEDNPVNREIATFILTDLGFQVETAEDGDAAVKKLTGAVPGYYDGILMDIQMPVMDGYEATRTIRALPDDQLAAIPIIAMTANAFKEDQEAAREAGMQGHIAKPIDMKALQRTLWDVLGSDRGSES